MGCKKFRLYLPAYSDGELNDADRHRVEAHIAGCPDCAREIETLGKLKSIFGARQKTEPDAYFEARLQAKITEAQNKTLPLFSRKWVALTFAILLVAFTFAINYRRYPTGKNVDISAFIYNQSEENFDDEIISIYYGPAGTGGENV